MQLSIFSMSQTSFVSSPKLQSRFWLLFFSLTVSKAVPSKQSQKQVFSHCLLHPHSDLCQYHHPIPIRAPAAATVILCTVDQMVSLVPALFSWWCQPCRIWSLSASSPPSSPLTVECSSPRYPGDCLLTPWEMPPLTFYDAAVVCSPEFIPLHLLCFSQ